MLEMALDDQEIINRFPVGYYPLHPNVSLNFQMNRFWNWVGDKQMLDELRAAGTRINSYDDWAREMFDLSDKALAAGRRLPAAYYAKMAIFFLDPSDARVKPAFKRFLDNVLAESGVTPENHHLFPYQQAELTAYRFTPEKPRGTIVVVGGYDSATQSPFIRAVATVRADFYDPLIRDLGSILPAQQMTPKGMSRDELKRTIIEPAKMARLSFDPPSLVEQILHDVGEDEGRLPLLQHALRETWARRAGSVMTGDSYARSGGVREAIRLTAERTFEGLSPDDQQAARKLFLRLVTPGEGQEDTRARTTISDEPALRKIVDQFAGPRTRLLVTGSNRANQPTVEVAHEALIRTWPRLRKWVDTNRDKLRARAAIVQAMGVWEENKQRADLLLPAGFQLVRARELMADPGDITIDDIKNFIDESEAADARYRDEKAESERKRQAAEVEAATARAEIAERARRQQLAELEAARAREDTAKARAEVADRESLRQAAELEAAKTREQATIAAAVASRRLAWRTSVGVAAAVVLIIVALLGLSAEVLRRAAQKRSGNLLGTIALALAKQPLTFETAAVIPAVAAYGWRLGRSADGWNAMQTLLWTGVSRTVPHESQVQQIAFSQNGTLLATASIDRKVRVARTADGVIQDAWPIDARQTWANAVAFSHDGMRVVAGGGLGGLLNDGERHGRARMFQVGSTSALWDIETPAPVYVVALDPLEKFVAIGSDDGMVRLIDIAEKSGSVIVQKQIDTQPIRALAFSHDGKMLAAGSLGGKVKIMRTNETSDPLQYEYGNVEVTALAFSPANKRSPLYDDLLAIGLSDGSVRLRFAVAGGAELSTLKHDGGAINAVVFSADGRMIATGGNDATARIFGVEEQNQIYRMPHEKAVEAVAFSPDGRLLATGTEKLAQILSIPDRKVRAAIAHGDRVRRVSFNADGKLLATAGEGHNAQIFPLVDGFAEVGRLTGAWGMRVVAFSRDSRVVAAGGEDGIAYLHALSGSVDRTELAVGGTVGGLAFSPSGNELAVWDQGGAVRIVRLADGRDILRFAHAGQPNAAAFSPDGTFFAAGGLDGTAELVTVADWKTLRTFEFNARPQSAASRGVVAPGTGAPPTTAANPIGEEHVFSLSFIGDSAFLALGSSYTSSGGIVHLLRLRDLNEFAFVPRGPEVVRVALDPGAELLAIAGWRTASVVEIEDGHLRSAPVSPRARPLRALAPFDAGVPIALSPEGSWLAAGGGWSGPNVVIMQPLNGSKTGWTITHGDEIEGLTFSPDGAYLATASRDEMRVFDLATRKLRALISHNGAINRQTSDERDQRGMPGAVVSFSPDGRIAVTAGGDGTARIWSTDFDDILQRLCAGPGRNLTLSEWGRYLGEIEWQRTCEEWPVPDDVRAAGITR
jgi:WD40 repeat protein